MSRLITQSNTLGQLKAFDPKAFDPKAFDPKALGFIALGMMLCAICVISCFTGSCFAADVLHFRNGQTQTGRIKDIQGDLIRFKPQHGTLQNGNLLVVQRSNLASLSDRVVCRMGCFHANNKEQAKTPDKSQPKTLEGRVVSASFGQVEVQMPGAGRQILHRYKVKRLELGIHSGE